MPHSEWKTEHSVRLSSGTEQHAELPGTDQPSDRSGGEVARRRCLGPGSCGPKCTCAPARSIRRRNTGAYVCMRCSDMHRAEPWSCAISTELLNSLQMKTCGMQKVHDSTLCDDTQGGEVDGQAASPAQPQAGSTSAHPAGNLQV